MNYKRHPWCESNPKGWFGHGHSIKNPAEVTLDFDYYLPDGKIIPKGTKHFQWETPNFGWWKWNTTDGLAHLSKY